MAAPSFFGNFMLLAAIFTILAAVTAATPISDIGRRAFLGKATYFSVGLGSCGQTNVDSDYIVALNPATYASGSHCGKNIRITDETSGASATATVLDTCPGCGPWDIDMSPSLFEHFGSLNKGVLAVKWEFV